MTHPQFGRTTLVVVRRWPTPVLGQEQPEPMTGATEIGGLGIQRREDVIGLYALIEAVDESLEELHPADGYEQ